MTKTETAIRALQTVLEAAFTPLGVAVERNPDRPDASGASGVAILRDGEQRDAIAMLSPLRFDIEHVAELFLAGDDEAERDALLETALAALAADRTLGGAVDTVQVEAPARDLAEYEGAEAGRTLNLPVVLYFLADTAAG